MDSLFSFKNFDAIIFDLGGVIIQLDYDETVKCFQKSIPDLDPSVFYGKEKQLSFFSEYELGKIDTLELLSRFNAHYRTQFSLGAFRECWNAMIFDFPKERIELLLRLRARGVRCFLLSNINELHEAEVEPRFQKLNYPFPFPQLFDEVFYSHRLGLRKPDQSVFDLILKKHDLDPRRTLFIDDSVHHVEGAEKSGVRTIHFKKTACLSELEVFKGA